jgi:dihydrofolate reductase
LHFSPDVQAVMNAYWPTIDTILMGRGTWEVSAQQGAGKSTRKSKTDKSNTGTSRAKPKIQTYVFSRTLDNISGSGVHLIRDDAGPFVADLKRQPGKGICVMGGGVLATSLLEAGVVDEVGMNVHPVLLGAGVPLFRDVRRRIPLQLVETRRMDGGCVLCRYHVSGTGA